MNPRGPEQPMVYWLRRASIAIVALVAVVGLWWLAGGGRGGDATPAASASAVASPAASAVPSSTALSSLAPMPTPTGSGVPAISAAPSVDATDATTAEPVGEGVTADAPIACTASGIQVLATTDKKSYVRGEQPILTLEITNVGTVPCTRDVGPKANSLTITSGGYHVWSSDDCGAGTKSKIVTLKPNKPVATSLKWDGMTSQKGCTPGSTRAKPGRYQVTGKNMKAKSPESSFSITKKKG